MARLVALYIAIVLACSAACAPVVLAKQQKRPSSILEWMVERDDMSRTLRLFSEFPYLLKQLSDPEANLTAMLPTDLAWLREAAQYTGAAVPRKCNAKSCIVDAMIAEGATYTFQYRNPIDRAVDWRRANKFLIPGLVTEFNVSAYGCLYFETGPGDVCVPYSTLLGQGVDMFLFTEFECPMDDFDYHDGYWTNNCNVTGKRKGQWLDNLVRIQETIKIGKNLVVHVLDGMLFPDVAPPDTFYPTFWGYGELTSEESSLKELVDAAYAKHSLITGPWDPFLSPRLTMFLPTREAFAAYFEANRAAGNGGPTSAEDMAALSLAQWQYFINAHLISQPMYMWDLLNVAVLATTDAQRTLTTLAKTQLIVSVYTGPDIEGEALDHPAQLTVAGTNITGVVLTWVDLGGNMWGVEFESNEEYSAYPTVPEASAGHSVSQVLLEPGPVPAADNSNLMTRGPLGPAK